MRRFELVDGKSNKFWEVGRSGRTLELRWGKIGTNGQTKEKELKDDAAAQKELDKLVGQKTKKGYVEVEGATAPEPIAQPADEPETAKKAAAKKAPTKKAPAKPAPSAAPTGGIDVDLSELPDVPPGWGHGHANVPEPPSFTLDDAHSQWREQARLKLEKYKQGSAKGKHGAITDELHRFVKDPTRDLSAEARLAFLRFGHSWYSPPKEMIRLHFVRFGFAETAKAVCHFGTYRYDYDTFVVLDGPGESIGESAARLCKELFEVRHGVATLDDASYASLLAYAEDAWDQVHPMVRPAVAFVLNHGGLAARALETAPTVWYWNLHFNAGIAALHDAAAAMRWAPHVPRDFLPFAPALVKNLGLGALPVLTAIAKGRRKSGDPAVARAIASIPHEDAMLAALELIHLKDHQKIIHAQFARHPVVGGQAVRRALASASPALRAAARSVAAVTDAKDALAPAGTAAPATALPAILVDPPWSGGGRDLKIKTAKIEMLPHEESIVAPAGTVDSDPYQDLKSAKQVLAKLKKAKKEDSLYRVVMVGDLLHLSADEFREVIATYPDHVISFSRWRWGKNTGNCGELIEKFGVATIDLLIQLSPSIAVSHLAEADTPRAAPVMAKAFAGVKSLRDDARAWFDRYPRTAAIGLAPEVFAKAKARKSAAIRAICLLVELGHGDVVRAVGADHGGDVERVLAALSELTPLDIVPAKIPKSPPFLNPMSLDAPRLRDGDDYLDAEALGNFCTMLSFSTYDEEYPGIEVVAELCTPASLEAFAHSAFEAWLANGAPGSAGWAMLALGWFGGDDAARRLAPLIRRWPKESGAKRAQLGLDVLAKIGTDVALTNVFNISQKLKFKSVKARAEEVVTEIAEGRGLTLDELGDRLVPDFDLEADGTTTIDYGARTFEVTFDEALVPVVLDGQGKRLKSLPKPGKSDDSETAKPEQKRFRDLKKDLRSVARQQIERLQMAMCARRSWSAADFRQFFIAHPLMINLIRRLVLKTDAGTLFIVDAGGETVDVSFEPVPLAGQIHIPHRLDLSDEDCASWGTYLGDHEIVQPFAQLSRQVFRPADFTTNGASVIDVALETTAPRWVHGIEKSGWQRWDIIDGGAFNSHERLGPNGHSAIVFFDGAVGVGYIEEKESVKVERIDFRREGQAVDIAEVDPVFFSEVMSDVEALRP